MSVVILTYIINPGIIFSSKNEVEKEYCKDCDFFYPYHRNLKHCSLCHVCVIGRDHHCGVFGKCIGTNNIVFFYLFLFFALGKLISSMITLIYILANIKN